MESKQKPSCEYGAKCYRKNPQHFKTYSHPKELHNGMNSRSGSNSPVSKKPKLEKTAKDRKRQYKQSTLQFKKQNGCSSQVVPNSEELEVTLNKDEGGKNLNESDNTTQELVSPKSDDKGINSESDNESSDDAKDVQSTSWVFIKKDSDKTATKTTTDDLEGKSVEEIIKTLFLVEMPRDFYSFYEFCKSIDQNDPLNALKLCQLKLVGPYDILNGKKNYPADKKLALCHWRFYYDPPECQTVLASPSGFHIGYWRDDPKKPPVFVASNNPNKDCKFVIEAENIFGCVNHYLLDYLKSCDPFTKVKVTKLQSSLKDWAEKNEFKIEKNTASIMAKRKKNCSATFHGAFISVPVDSSTEVGYRPLLETDGNLKKICKNIMAADDPDERESLWEDIEQLIRAANIANDESDFGNGLELGIDLFCMGSPIFHDVVEYLLTTAYDLLKRPEFGEIIRVHLKNRRKGDDMSIF